MIDEKRMGEIRERAKKLCNWPFTDVQLNEVLLPLSDDIRDLLSAHDALAKFVTEHDPVLYQEKVAALVADNAELLRAARLSFGGGWRCGFCAAVWNATMEPIQHKEWCQMLQPHPGTALLARHAEELATKERDLENERRAGDAILRQSEALQSDLDRALWALKKLRAAEDCRDGVPRCYVCDAEGTEGEAIENLAHNPVTLNGLTGPCPAEREEG